MFTIPKFDASTIKTGVIVLLTAIILYLLLDTPDSKPDSRGSADSTFYWKNAYNQEVASQKGTKEQFALQDAHIKHLLDSVADVYGTESRRIQELIIATVRGRTTLVKVPGTKEVDIIRDTIHTECPPIIKNIRETFASKWYTAKVQLGDSSYLNLETRDTITAIWKRGKEGNIFNRKEYLQFDISFADTSRHISGLTTYRRYTKPKEFSVNLESELLYLDGHLKPIAGIGIERDAGRFTASGGIYKDLSPYKGGDIRLTPWAGKAGLKFKLIKL